MCMSSETTKGSSSTGNKPTPTEGSTTVIPEESRHDHQQQQHGGSGTSNSHDHPQQQQQQQQPASLRGLSPTSVMSGGKSSRDSSSSSSHDRTTAILRHETVDDRDDDDDDHQNVCGWSPGLVRWRRERRIREPRTSTPTTTEPPLPPLSLPSQYWTYVSLFCAGTAMAILMIHFSLLLPFTLSPAASQQTYVWAQWTYQHQLSHFDNTILTYGTDYFLAACMMTLIHMIPNCSSLFDTTAYYTRGLLGSYMISVLAGGWAHQTVTTIGQQNTTAFRVTWTICVGAVAMASFYMGAAASSLRQYDTTSKQRLQQQQQNSTSSGIEATSTAWTLDRFVPIIPVSFWFVYAAGISYMVVIGGFSFQRPACDIFVVGITQFPSTFYMMLVLYGFGVSDGELSHGPNRLGNDDRQKSDAPATKSADEVAIVPVVRLSNRMKYLACCGFILNAPLLPLYPILVQYTTWSLGCINTLLHTWLLIAWTCQGMSLRQIGVQMIRQEQPVPRSSQ